MREPRVASVAGASRTRNVSEVLRARLLRAEEEHKRATEVATAAHAATLREMGVEHSQQLAVERAKLETMENEVFPGLVAEADTTHQSLRWASEERCSSTRARTRKRTPQAATWRPSK